MREDNLNSMTKDKGRNSLWVILPCLVLSILLFETYIFLVQPQVPYMDSMLYLLQVDKILSGKATWMSIYGTGEHRGLLFPMVLLLEWYLWAVDARVTTLLTGGVVAATFYFWLRALVSQRDIYADQSKSVIPILLLGVAASIIIVSPAAFELWTLDLGFAQLIKNFLIVLFLYQLSIGKFWQQTYLGAFLVGICGAFLILVVTYGWSYPFLAAVSAVLFCVFLSAPKLRTKAAIIVVCMYLAQYLYFRLGHGVFSAEPTAGSSATIIDLIKGILFGAGSSFMGAEAMTSLGVPSIVPMVLGALLLFCVFVASIRALIFSRSEQVFALGLVVFSILVLVGVTFARGKINYQNTGASRYFVDYVWLLLAPILILMPRVEQSTVGSFFKWLNTAPLQSLFDVARKIFIVLFIIALVGHILTWAKELRTAPYRAVIFKNMADVYRNGVANESDAILLQSPFEVARKGVEVAQGNELAVLGSDESLCSLTKSIFTGDWYSPAEDGSRWMGKGAEISTYRCAPPVALNFYLPENFSPRKVQIRYDAKQQLVQLMPGKSVTILLDPFLRKNTRIFLSVDVTTNLAQQGIGEDIRDLGVLLTAFGN